MGDRSNLEIPNGWIRAAREQQDLAFVLQQSRITSDADYLAARAALGAGSLAQLDAIRFRFSCGGDAPVTTDSDARLEIFAGAPPEVLAFPVSRLRFGTRS